MLYEINLVVFDDFIHLFLEHITCWHNPKWQSGETVPAKHANVVEYEDLLLSFRLWSLEFATIMVI